MGNGDAIPGPIPTGHLSRESSQIVLPPPPSRPTTWQVMAGFLAAAAVLAGGMVWVADRVYLPRSEYHKDQQAQTQMQAELKASVDANTKAAEKLERSVEGQASQYNQMQAQLKTVERLVRRRR